MSVFIILLLLFSGTILILLELFILPGFVVGIIGALLCIWGAYEAFHTLGPDWGWVIIGATIIVNAVLAWIALKNIHRSPFAIRTKIDGRVNEFKDYGLKIGDRGRTMTDLRPEGRAVFGEELVSVWSLSGFISGNQEVIVVKMAENKIFVSPVNHQLS